MKRIFDLIVAVKGVLILSPIFLICSFLAKKQSHGTIFYKAIRIGKDEKPFFMLKFRTMISNADAIGLGLTTFDDDRITPIGAFLRRWKLDELPQLINVIRGEMSLIGPRPESPKYVQHYTADQKHVLTVRPGITGPAQYANRDEAEKLKDHPDPEHFYITKLLPEKIAIDLDYIQNQNLFTDLYWLIRTVFGVLFR